MWKVRLRNSTDEPAATDVLLVRETGRVEEPEEVIDLSETGSVFWPIVADIDTEGMSVTLRFQIESIELGNLRS